MKTTYLVRLVRGKYFRSVQLRSLQEIAEIMGACDDQLQSTPERYKGWRLCKEQTRFLHRVLELNTLSTITELSYVHTTTYNGGTHKLPSRGSVKCGNVTAYVFAWDMARWWRTPPLVGWNFNAVGHVTFPWVLFVVGYFVLLFGILPFRRDVRVSLVRSTVEFIPLTLLLFYKSKLTRKTTNTL